MLIMMLFGCGTEGGVQHNRCNVLWDVTIYICKDNHLSNCSIIFITIAHYTQMYWNNRTALAEDNTATP
jgi:hypothetical protein